MKESSIPAFGGGPLCEGNIVRLAYMDEAGISKNEPFAVVSAVIVHGDKQAIPVRKHLERLVEKHIPEQHRDGFVFHASHIFNGVKGTDKLFGRENPEWPIERRLAIADDLAAIPGLFGLPIAIGTTDRASYPATVEHDERWPEHDIAVSLHVTVFSVAVMTVDLWMRRHVPDENCILIVENNDQARSTILEVQNYHQNGPFDIEVPEEVRALYPLRHIIEDPLFQNKKPGSILQLADFVAYVLKKRRMQDVRYKRFFDPIFPWLVQIPDVAT